jgi:fatty acid desaturase
MAPASAAPIPTRINLALAACIVAMHAGILIVLPNAGAAPAWAIAAICVAALTTTVHWALIHEAIHGLLLPRRAANDRLARLLAILFGVPFRAVRFAHLRHHRYNRTPWGREEVYDPAAQPRWAAYGFHYLRISFGLYLGELALSLLCWMPREWLRARVHAMCPDPDDGAPGMGALADRDILGAPLLAQIRIDAVCVLALYGTAFAMYGRQWPILLGLLAARGFIASQLDHAPHHDTPLDRRDHALNLSAPRWLQCVLLNFNFHRTHHQNPNLPWRSLEAMSDREAGDIPFVRGVLRQWRGPIAIGRLSARQIPDTAA